MSDDFLTWAGGSRGEEAERVLAAIIPAASLQCEAFCRRTFARAAYADEAVDGRDTPLVRVLNPPIDTAQAVAVKLIDGATTTVDAGDYRVDGRTGFIKLLGLPYDPRRRLKRAVFPRGFRNVLLSYTGGYTAIPADVKLGCILVVAAMWFAKGQNPVVASKSAAQFARTRGAIDESGLPADAAALLAPYRLLQVAGAGGADPWAEAAA